MKVVRNADHVLKTPAHLAPQGLSRIYIHDSGELAVYERFFAISVGRVSEADNLSGVAPLHLHDRVDEIVDRDAFGVEELTKGIHDERALGYTGPQHGYRGVPTLIVHLGIKDLDINAARLTLLHESPRAESDVSEDVGTPRMKKFLRGPGKENFRKRDPGLRLVRIEKPLELSTYRVDGRRLVTEAENHRVGGVAHD
jgi:hypothetical protein